MKHPKRVTIAAIIAALLAVAALTGFAIYSSMAAGHVNPKPPVTRLR